MFSLQNLFQLHLRNIKVLFFLSENQEGSVLLYFNYRLIWLLSTYVLNHEICACVHYPQWEFSKGFSGYFFLIFFFFFLIHPPWHLTLKSGNPESNWKTKQSKLFIEVSKVTLSYHTKRPLRWDTCPHSSYLVIAWLKCALFNTHHARSRLSLLTCALGSVCANETCLI